jgi:hypothetical protein
MKSTTEETQMTSSPEHAHAVEIDTAIAEAYSKLGEAQQKLDTQKVSIIRAAGGRQQRDARRRIVWNMTDTEAQVVIEKAIADNADEGEYGRFTLDGYWTNIAELTEKLAKLAAAREARDAARGEYLALDAQYTGWSRFFLVNNTGGHIHSSMQCSTCRFDTSFSWLPTLSGLSEKDAVDAHGAILCTVCFPSAPVEWTNQYELDAAKKAEASCPASGLVEGSYRRTGIRGDGYGYCKDCGEYVSVTSTYKIRKHKKAAA